MTAPDGTSGRSERGARLQIEGGRQLHLNGDIFVDCVPPRLPTQATQAFPRHGHNKDLFIATFRERCSRVHSTATAQKYAWCASDVVRLASERLGDGVTVVDLFHHPLLLGSVLTESKRAGGGPEVSGWTVANRRTAMRSIAGLMAPELAAAGIDAPVAVVDSALSACAERVGTHYRLPKAPSRNRGGRAATPTEVRAVTDAMRKEPGWAGQRDAILVELLFLTGTRVNATLALDGAALGERSDGRGVMRVHAKHRRDSGEFLVPVSLMERINDYVSQFNGWARIRGLHTSIGVGVPGALWRTPSGKPLGYGSFVGRLTAACEEADVARLTPHAFRRAFATIATESLDRRTVSRAGGWLNTRLMDTHYVQRPAEVTKRRIARAMRTGNDDADRLPVTITEDQPAEVPAR